MFAREPDGAYDFGAVNQTRLIWILLAGAGCASPMSSLRADNHRLERSVEELRDDRRAQDRKMKDLEHQLALAHSSDSGAMPALRVEVVAPPPANAAPPLPDGARVIGIAEDGTEIVYEGDAALGKVATLDDDAPTAPPARRARTTPLPAPAPAAITDDALPTSTDRIEVTHHVPLAARAARAHVRDREPAPASAGDANADYHDAVELVKAGKYEPAVAALRAFIAHYPRHDYADNAQYWIGEALYAQKDFAHALTEFRATIEVYPRGNKVPDALLKLGYCYQALGQAEKARAVLEQVVNLYPKSEPAALAAKRLESK